MFKKKVISQHRVCLSCRNITQMMISHCPNCGMPFHQSLGADQARSSSNGWGATILLVGLLWLVYYSSPEIRKTLAEWRHGEQKTNNDSSVVKASEKHEAGVELKEIKILSANQNLIMWNANVQNKSADRTITNLSWKIEIYDSLRQIKVDELYVTQAEVGITETGKQIQVPPGETSYIISMLGNVGGTRWVWQSDYTLKISLEDYTGSTR